MTVPQASMLTRAFVSLSPFSFSPFLSLPRQPQSLTAILLFFSLKKTLVFFSSLPSHVLLTSLLLTSFPAFPFTFFPLCTFLPPPFPSSDSPSCLLGADSGGSRSLRWMRCQPNVDPTVSSQSSTNGQHPAGLSYSTKSGDIYTP